MKTEMKGKIEKKLRVFSHHRNQWGFQDEKHKLLCFSSLPWLDLRRTRYLFVQN